MIDSDGQGAGGPPAGDKGRKMRMDRQGSAQHGNAQVDPRVQTEIGKHLRAIYDDVINEPVPAKFMDLLKKLEQSTTQKN